MLLSHAKKDQQVEVCAIDGGKSLKNKLHSMGLVPGAKCSILKNDVRSPVIVMIKNSRIVIGRGVAEKIEVNII